MFFCDILGLFWKGSPHTPRGFEVIMARVGGGGFKYIFLIFFPGTLVKWSNFLVRAFFFRWGGKKNTNWKSGRLFWGFSGSKEDGFCGVFFGTKMALVCSSGVER